MTYGTELINSSSRPITVWDSTGPPLFAILPGNKRTLESVSPRTLYSRYSRVEWAPDGGVVLTPRPGFETPPAAAGDRPIVLFKADRLPKSKYAERVAAKHPVTLDERFVHPRPEEKED